MRTRIIPVVLVATVAAFALVGALSTRTAAQNPMGDADAEPAPFNPQMAAMMSMLIQPRHAKLGLAGKAENWVLAGYEFKELQAGFIVIGKEVPRFKGMPVADLFDAAMKQIFPVMDFAIKAGDSRQFSESYAKVTAGCNLCHTTADHPYIVIKVPEASSFPNQEFVPK